MQVEGTKEKQQVVLELEFNTLKINSGKLKHKNIT